MMKYRTRIYYTEEQKSVMWERWQQGEERNQVSHVTILSKPVYSSPGCAEEGIAIVPDNPACCDSSICERPSSVENRARVPLGY